jgi:hypothetical protein
METKALLTLPVGQVGAKEREELATALGKAIMERPDIASAQKRWDAAADHFNRLRKRPIVINAAVAEVVRRIDAEQKSFTDAVCGLGEVPTGASKLSNARLLKDELARALEPLVMDRVPRSEIRSLIAEAEFREALAVGLQDAASERLKTMIQGLAPVLIEEGGLTIDPQRTLAGALQRGAADQLAQAAECREKAAGIVKRFNLSD